MTLGGWLALDTLTECRTAAAVRKGINTIGRIGISVWESSTLSHESMHFSLVAETLVLSCYICATSVVLQYRGRRSDLI